MKKLILIELNELNFNYVQRYIDKENLPTFKYLLQNNLIETYSESEYKKLEPWIQWVSAHTGKTADEHKIFRLGDMEKANINQIFEIVDKHYDGVSCISPMNTINRLSESSLFIPDPWTNTNSDKSWWSRNISKMVNQTVNDNSNQRITLMSIIIILLSFIKYVRIKKYISMITLFIGSIGSKWRKAIFFDKLLHEISMYHLKKRKIISFHTVFFNSIAHIQHHYFYNAKLLYSKLKNPTWYINPKKDPFLEALKEFDQILNDYLNMKEFEILIATGLTQEPCEDLKYYWRPKDHKRLLNRIGIKYKDVKPRMTQDFLIEFDNEQDLKNANEILASFYEKDSGLPIFTEIDKRKNSLFVVLGYDKELKNKIIKNKNFTLFANEIVSFVGIKNGKHDSKGFVLFTNGLKPFMPSNNFHVSKIFDVIRNFFLKDISYEN